MISIDVVFFGPAKDFAGAESTLVELGPGATVADLRRALEERFPSLAPALPTIRIAVNQSFVDDDTVLAERDEVALIPPVSGGTGDGTVWVDLTADPIRTDRVRSFVEGDPALGGIVTFEGATRKETDPRHGALARLEYEAYGAMATSVLRGLAFEAKRRWSLGRVAVVHRVGAVPPGEISVMIAVASAHRDEGFAACRWLVDTLKKDVPIWKKDVFEGGYTRWVDPGDRCPGACRGAIGGSEPEEGREITTNG